MADIHRFLFETSFDIPDEPEPVEEEAVLDVVEEPVVEAPPTFSQEELDAAAQQGHLNGREEGVREAMDSIDKLIADCLGSLSQVMPELFQAQDQAFETINQNSLSIALAIVRKMIPDMARQNALGEIERVVMMCMDRILDEPRVTVRVNDAIAEQVNERLAQVVMATGYEGRMMVLPDPAIPAGDCGIEWSGGGAERDSRSLWEEVDRIVEENMGALREEGMEEFDSPAPEAEEPLDEAELEPEPEEAPPEPAPVEETDAEQEPLPNDGAEMLESTDSEAPPETAEPEAAEQAAGDEMTEAPAPLDEASAEEPPSDDAQDAGDENG